MQTKSGPPRLLVVNPLSFPLGHQGGGFNVHPWTSRGMIDARLWT